MKATITIKEDNLSGICFEKDGEIVSWNKLTKGEKIKFLNSLSKFHELYTKFF